MKKPDIVSRLLQSKNLDKKLVSDAVEELTSLRRSVEELEKLVFTTTNETPEPTPRKRRKAPKFPRGTPVKERMLAQIEIDPETGCWIWLGSGARFYPVIADDDGKWVCCHKKMYEIHTGYRFEKGEEGLHSCDNTWCINPEHIRPGTHKENMQDRSVRRRGGRWSKLSLEQAIEIRQRYYNGESAYKLAGIFGITEGTAWRIAVRADLRDKSGNAVPNPNAGKSGRERQSTLTEEDVRDIKKRLRRGERPKDIAVIYNTASYNISNIKHGKRWASVR